MELPLILSLTLFLLLLYASAYISSAETALFSLSSHTVKSFESSTDSKKNLVAKLLSHPRDLLVTVFMVNTFINIVLQNIASDMFGKEASWILKVFIPLILTLILGEIIPKYIGLQNNLKLSFYVAPTIEKLQYHLRWIQKGIIAITAPISRIMFFFLKKEHPVSDKEMEHVLETSKKHGVIQKEEAELLEGLLDLQSSEVKEIMWPKEDIFLFRKEEPISKLIHLFCEEGKTRIPVTEGSQDTIRGIITATKFFKYQKKIKVGEDLIPFLERPFFTPENTKARTLLRTMDEQQKVLALVVDEYGSLVGLLSREDLIEVVVGKIENTPGFKPLFTPAGKNEVICSGKWELTEFNEYFDVDIESKNHLVTMGGYLTELMGEIPKPGTSFSTDEFLFKILAATETRISRVFIKKLTNNSTGLK